MFTNKPIGPEDAPPIAAPAGYFDSAGLQGDLAKRDDAVRHLTSGRKTDRLQQVGNLKTRFRIWENVAPNVAPAKLVHLTKAGNDA